MEWGAYVSGMERERLDINPGGRPGRNVISIDTTREGSRYGMDLTGEGGEGWERKGQRSDVGAARGKQTQTHLDTRSQQQTMRLLSQSSRKKKANGASNGSSNSNSNSSSTCNGGSSGKGAAAGGGTAACGNGPVINTGSGMATLSTPSFSIGSNGNSKTHSRSSSMRSLGSLHMSITKNTTASPSSKVSPNNSALSIPALSSVSPLLFSKSPSLSIMNNNSNNGHNSASFEVSNENQRLELIKVIEQSLSKFTGLKKNNTFKANILRLNLLPFLRFPTKPFININELLSTSTVDLNVDLLFLEARTLLNWWSELLNILLVDFQSISALDRNCFFESVSRLLSHNIWLLFQANVDYSPQFNEIYENFRRLLLQTFEFAILRLNSKSVSLSASIFIGKILAYAFFNLPGISRGLSFLLNTKLVNYKKIYNLCIFDSFNNLNPSFMNQFPNILGDLATQFPNHLAPLIGSNIQPRDVNYIIEAQFMNPIFPPREKIEGIRETKGVWVNRWSSVENISLFCSFFRNYLTISSVYLKNFPMMMIDQYYIFGMPGFLAFLTHIYQIFSLQLKNSAIRNSNSNSKLKSNIYNNNIPYNDTLLVIPPKVSNESNIDKCFNILRDLLVNPRNSNERLLKPGVIKGYENILKLFITKTNILDTFMVETLLDIFIQFLKTIDVIDENNLNEMNHSLIDWNFWLNVLIRLLDSNNLNCEVKAISTFYQIWDFIPNDVYHCEPDVKNRKYWISDPSDHLKMNVIEYLLCPKNWFKFFGHYMPFERSLYVKLLVWKILGISSFENLVCLHDFKLKNSCDEAKIKKLIKTRLHETYAKTKNCVFQPSDLLMNKKFVINRTVGSDIKKRDKKLRTYPYEVLDDAVYTASKQPSSISSKKSSTSLAIPRSTSVGSLNDSKESKGKGSNWMERIFNKSQSQPAISDTNSNGTNGSKVFGKLLNLSKSSSEKKETNSPISSLSSSLSSLELNQNLDLNSNSSDNGNLVDSDNKHFSCPPEWNHELDVEKENYEFILVDDELKMQSFIQKLNDFNSSIKKFHNRGKVLMVNDEPKLPSIKVKKSLGLHSSGDSKINIESLESIVDDNETKDDNFLGNDELEDEMIDLSGGFHDVNALHLDVTQNHGYSTGTSIYYDGINPEIKEKMKDTDAAMTYLSNGLLEYNEEIVVFENFLAERIKELDYNDLSIMEDILLDKIHDGWNVNLNDASSSSFLEISMSGTIRDVPEKTYRVSREGYLKLKRDIPNIVPELPGNRLNAY